MKTLALMATLLLSNALFAADSVKVCNKEDSSQSLTFTVVNKQSATLATSDGSPVQNFKITKTIVSAKGDKELTEATGEVNVSYVQYVLSSEGSEDVIMTAIGASGAKHLVLIGPMGKLIELGSSANCK